MKSIFVIAFFVNFNSITFGGVVSFQKINHNIKQTIYKGYYSKAINQINKELKKKSNSIKQQIFLYKTKGDIYRSRGDLDETLKYWLKSNKLRTKIYKKGDYHLAWNYALISSYHYDKIEVPLTKMYADSCLSLIQNLNLEQQKEIEIFKIWNILAQSIKQSIYDLPSIEKLQKYERIREYYFKSEKFILANNVDQIYLARTYHLIANSYFDNIHEFIKTKDKKGADFYFKNALLYYQKSIAIWEKYRSIPHGKAGSYYLIGMMYSYFTKEIIPDKHLEASYYFEQSLKAFGIDKKKSNLNYLSSLPTKESVLQCIRYYTEYEIQNLNKENYKTKIQKIQDITQIAIKVWEYLYLESKSKNPNLLLSTYNLIPYKEKIEVELLKKQYSEKWSLEKIFEANQFLKYYDLSKFKNKKSLDSRLQIKNIQQKLKQNEVFLDLIASQYNNNYIIEITKNKSKLIELGPSIPFLIDSLKTAITEIDYTNFTSHSSKIYELLFSKIELKNKNRIIICPDGVFNYIPFEALLYSKKNKQLNDYRKLDYLIHHFQIDYVLAPRYFTEPITSINLKGSIFCPTYKKSDLSELPFSQKLASSLKKDDDFIIYKGKKANKETLLKVKTPLVHISGHGEIDTENSVFSTIVLTNSNLTTEDIYKWKKSPEFVVVNTCNSGNGKIRIGDGVDGIVRAFHTSTTKASISNLWAVDDKASNDLFSSFYANINENSSINVSLRTTKINCIKRATSPMLAAPYYWAGHKMIGEISFSNDYSIFKIILMIGLIIFIYFFLKFRKNYLEQ